MKISGNIHKFRAIGIANKLQTLVTAYRISLPDLVACGLSEASLEIGDTEADVERLQTAYQRILDYARRQKTSLPSKIIVEALVSYHRRHQAAEHKYQWNRLARAWQKEIHRIDLANELARVPFQVEIIEKGDY